jgi:hypothetical protein
MMGWTDRAETAFPLNGLHWRQGPCLLYVSSRYAALRGFGWAPFFLSGTRPAPRSVSTLEFTCRQGLGYRRMLAKPTYIGGHSLTLRVNGGSGLSQLPCRALPNRWHAATQCCGDRLKHCKINPFAESTSGTRELRSIARSHPTRLSRLHRRDW